MRLRVARKIIKRCRFERARHGLSHDYGRYTPYRKHAIVVALRRIMKAMRIKEAIDTAIYFEGLKTRIVQ